MSQSLRWIVFVCVLALPAQFASAQVFDFEAQFSGATNPTATGWSYLYQANGLPSNTLRDGNYEPLSFPATWTGGGSVALWDPIAGATVDLPMIGKNTSGAPFVTGTLTVPVGHSTVHPNPSQIAVVSWVAPASGTADISFLFADQNVAGGNGIKYFVERGNSEFTLAQAAFADGGTSGSVTLPGSLRVTAGERINFIVDPNGTDHGADSTRVSATVNFSASAATTTNYRAAADLIAFEATASGLSVPATGINGVWSYGTSPTNGGAFTAYGTGEHTDSWNGNASIQGWALPPGPGSPLVPLATVNVSPTATSPCCSFNIDADQMFLHAGDQNTLRDFSVVRWTAPGDGTIDLSAVWVQKDGNAQAEIDALLNGTSLFPAGIQFATGGDGTLLSQLEIAVAAGATIDFIVGLSNVGTFNSTSTGFDANIRFTAAAAVPEPASVAIWLLLGMAGAGFGIVRYRQRYARA